MVHTLLTVFLVLLILIPFCYATPYEVFAITEISPGDTCGFVQEYKLTKMNTCDRNVDKFQTSISNGTHIQLYTCPNPGCNIPECKAVHSSPIGRCYPYGTRGVLSAFTRFPHYSISIHPFISDEKNSLSLIGTSYESCSNPPISYLARRHKTCLVLDDTILPQSDCNSPECLDIRSKKSGQFVCGDKIYFFHGFDSLNCTGPRKIFNMTESDCKNSTGGYAHILKCSNANSISFVLSLILFSLAICFY
jgi:hypothetical protein